MARVVCRGSWLNSKVVVCSVACGGSGLNLKMEDHWWWKGVREGEGGR